MPTSADDLQARPRGVEGRDVRRAVQEPPGVVAPVERRGERERPGVRHPAGQARGEPIPELGPDPEERRPGAAAEPLQAAADVDVDPQRRDVDGDRADGLIAVDDRDGADLPRPARDRRDVVDVGDLEEDVREVDERRPLVDRLDEPLRCRP